MSPESLVAIGMLLFVVLAALVGSKLMHRTGGPAKVGCPACGKTVDSTDETCRWCHVNIIASLTAAAAAPRTEADLMEGMTPAQRELFLAEMATVRKDRGTAILLCLLLGGLGVQHFYLGNILQGLLYLLLCWTFIPVIVSLIEVFFIGAQTDQINMRNARLIAARIRVAAAPPA